MTEIRYDVTDGVALITLDAPERRNALSVEMSRELIDAARTAESDDDGRCGRRHRRAPTSAPARSAASWPTPAATRSRTRPTATSRRSMPRSRPSGRSAVPTVAAVRGAAVGAGLNLALATDLRIVSRTARLLPGFAQIGIHPGGGHFTLINRVAGREAAAALGLFGDEVDGDRAVALGLAWAAYDDGDVQDEAMAIAGRVAKDPALARRMVASFRRETAPGGLPWDVAVELERSPQMWSLRRKHGG